ncbi:sulfotransferase [Nostoc sp. UHCC 0702]|nr:sulfotransferase [Nostoc sp. UHCC 0702]
MVSFAQPIFILGAPCSFTSLICAMLGQHPQVYGVPELNLFVGETLEQMMKKLTDLLHTQTHGLLRAIAQLYAGEQTIESIDMAYRWIYTHSHWTTAQIYLELCRRVAPLRIVEQNPIYSNSPDILVRIRETFPKAHYLHIVRHPRSHGNSFIELSYGNIIAIANNSIDYSTNPPTLDPQILWYKSQRNILDFLSTIPNEQHMRVRCEDILNEPVLYFQKISCWLNLSWNVSVIEAILHPEYSPYACFGPFGANLGNDPNFLKSPTFCHTTIAASKLEGSLPWRSDSKGFLPHVIQLAQELGYD